MDIKFGVIIPQGWQVDLPPELTDEEKYSLIVKMAVDAEKYGFDSIWFFDHFHTIPYPGKFPVFECWTLLSALANITEKIRLGEIVTCALYRNPAYLGKISSIIDVMSKGRLELGIGACWYEHEFKGYGYEFPRPKVRIEMLKETVEIIKKMWTEEVTNYDGKYFKLVENYNYPKPLQKPHPPILIGGGGEKYTLRVVARLADKWNYGWRIEQYLKKRAVLEKHLEKAGRTLSDIILTYTSDIIVGEDLSELRREYEEWRRLQSRILGKEVNTPFEDYASTHIAGTPEKALEKLKELVSKAGITEFIMYDPLLHKPGQMKLLYEKVVKPLKEWGEELS